MPSILSIRTQDDVTLQIAFQINSSTHLQAHVKIAYQVALLVQAAHPVFHAQQDLIYITVNVLSHALQGLVQTTALEDVPLALQTVSHAPSMLTRILIVMNVTL